MGRTIAIWRARVLTTRVDGGHCYLAGYCAWKNQTVPVYAYMLDKRQEERLLWQHDGTARVVFGRHSYTQGLGLSLWDCRVIPAE